MISPERKRKLFHIYMALVFVSTLKGCILLVPRISSTVDLSYMMWNKIFTTSNEKNVIDKEVLFPLVDQLLLMEVLIWELCPIELVLMQTLKLTAGRICLWVMVHLFLSALYITNLIIQLDEKNTCAMEISFQVVSVLIVLAILGFSRALN